LQEITFIRQFPCKIWSVLCGLNKNFHSHYYLHQSYSIDWQTIDKQLACCYSEDMGRPANTTRLMVGLHYLKHTYNESDESVIERWVENPYWQYFCGYEYMQHQFPNREDKNKLYSLDAPEVECISKGKAHKRYEFGCKVSFSVTHKNNWITSASALQGNPYDGR